MSNLEKNPSQLRIKQRYLPHWELAGSVYFITFNTWEKLELNPEARQIVLDCCLFFDESINLKDKRYKTFAIVIMPDHVHWLVQPLAKKLTGRMPVPQTSISQTSASQTSASQTSISQTSASQTSASQTSASQTSASQNNIEYWSLSSILHSVKSYSSKQIPKVMKHIGTIWQDERYDRIMRNKVEFLDKWKYIRFNPVKANLSDVPENYPYLWETF